MFTSKPFVWFLVIFSSIYLQCGNSAVQKSQDSQTIKEGFLFIGKNSFDEGNLVFAVCDNNKTSRKQCNVVQENYPDIKNIRSCPITLQGEHNESDLSVRIGVVAVGKDKVVLYWGDDYNNLTTTEIGTVDLKTCKMNQVKIPDAGMDVLTKLFHVNTIVSYDDDSYDIFFDDPKRCGDKLCRAQINADGLCKGAPKASDIESGSVHYVSTIATLSPSKGYAYLKKNDADITLSLAKADGSEKQLAKYERTSLPIVSASNNVVSACAKPNADSDVDCSQYDEDGNVKFTTTITATNKNIRPTTVYNLPDGGTLVMLAEFEQCNQESGCTNEDRYRIVRIAADGTILGTVRTQELDDIIVSKFKTTYIYKNGESRYCATIVGQNSINDEQKPSDYIIIVSCFAESDFLV